MQNTTNKHSTRSTSPAQKRHLKIIRTPEEHKLAMERMLVLMKKSPPRGSPDSDEMEVLGLLIEKYEEKHFPITPPDPIEAIKFMLDQQGLKKKDLIPYIGSAPKVTEVLNGSRNLSLSMIRRLSEGLGIPVEILIQPLAKKSA